LAASERAVIADNLARERATHRPIGAERHDAAARSVASRHELLAPLLRSLAPLRGGRGAPPPLLLPQLPVVAALRRQAQLHGQPRQE